MKDRCYLLSLEEFFEGEDGKQLLKASFDKVDEGRREKAKRLKAGRAQAACVGAGLLLQFTVQESLKPHADLREDSDEPVLYSVSQILKLLKEPLPIDIDYGEKGKPYLREYPFFFNLSHSGTYAVCAVSDREVGVDIQQCTLADIDRLAARFFSEREYSAMQECATEEGKRRLFFRLWTRKEAYGKLLGAGVWETVGRNMLPDDPESDRPLHFLEWDRPAGYRIAVCQYECEGH